MSLTERLLENTRKTRIKMARQLSLPDLMMVINEKCPKNHEVEIIITKTENYGECPSCGSILPMTSTECPWCNEKFA